MLLAPKQAERGKTHFPHSVCLLQISHSQSNLIAFQTASGRIYHMTMNLVQVECPMDQTVDLQNCAILPGAPVSQIGLISPGSNRKGPRKLIIDSEELRVGRGHLFFPDNCKFICNLPSPPFDLQVGACVCMCVCENWEKVLNAHKSGCPPHGKLN